jgi:NAD(P)-dependent dehydrogenase (short-subunit alcohol dehydrogenase family)
MRDGMAPMEGKTVLVTGGSGGIGFVTARRLAALGARVIIVGRDAERGAAAVATLRAEAPRAQALFFAADLASQAEIRRLAATLREQVDRLDVLINNAGGMFGRRTLSPDGIEMTFALNHLAYVLLSAEVLPLLMKAGSARIVNVASRAHEGVRLAFDNLEGERRYNAWFAYKRSKLANIMFTYELARRLDAARVTVNALHPGFVRTEIGVAGGFLPSWLWRAVSLAAITPEQGAETSVYLAADASVANVTGRYFIKCRPVSSSPQSYDEAASRRLWQLSLARVGIREDAFTQPHGTAAV